MFKLPGKAMEVGLCNCGCRRLEPHAATAPAPVHLNAPLLVLPSRYPFEPPKVRFVTPIYHPNIDGEGRICLDILNMPPKGAWKPSLNVLTVLVSIGLLLAEPNPDDGLVADIVSLCSGSALALCSLCCCRISHRGTSVVLFC